MQKLAISSSAIRTRVPITLAEAIAKAAGHHAVALLQRLHHVGIEGWADLDRAALFEFRDTLLAELAPSSAKTYMAEFKSIISRYSDGWCPAVDYAKILRAKGERPVKTFLTVDELAALDSTAALSKSEELVKMQFIIGAKTGMRISDIRTARPEAVQGGALTYTAEKTGITAVVPCSEKTAEYIRRCAGRVPLSLGRYNEILRELCRSAGIIAPVAVHRGGRDLTGEKWQFVSSHTARISFCTNLARLGVPLIDISRMAGHSSTAMTERYIVATAAALPKAAMAYLQ